MGTGTRLARLITAKDKLTPRRTGVQQSPAVWTTHFLVSSLVWWLWSPTYIVGCWPGNCYINGAGAVWYPDVRTLYFVCGEYIRWGVGKSFLYSGCSYPAWGLMNGMILLGILRRIWYEHSLLLLFPVSSKGLGTRLPTLLQANYTV